MSLYELEKLLYFSLDCLKIPKFLIFITFSYIYFSIT
jgi:hypothetical protein